MVRIELLSDRLEVRDALIVLGIARFVVARRKRWREVLAPMKTSLQQPVRGQRK